MIKRNLFLELKAHLDKKEISLIIGPRQAGKTTLMSLLADDLNKRGEPTLILNYDIERDREFFGSQEKLLKKIELEIGKKKGYVFLDEIQRKENAGLFLKGLYDMNLPYKFIVSGSGSVELKEKIHESLAGRKRVFELGAVSFDEFVNYRTDYKYEDKLSDFFEVEKSRTRLFLEEFLNYGGYPKVILEETKEEKIKIIDEIYRSYVEKDIAYLLGVQKTDDFTRLLRLLASQIGNLANVSELSATLGISIPTVKNYLWYLEKTFILEKITPYFKNVRKEITKAPVYYFYDIGMRNYAAGDFGRISLDDNVGFVFENYVFNALKEKTKRALPSIHFWRTKDGAEVDFIVNSGEAVIPVEAKKQNLKRPEITRSLRSFIAKYNPKKAYVVNLALSDEITVGNTTVIFIPYYEFWLESFIL
ncbi:ATP-binding protein [Patescibacteria group bacterium]|nr:ATP-binding protein [Patescibacteria group bacterium]MBU4016143.1 ATP-binding protein [Patescibacteria group bacterium]MBU4099141.1 ATP-binding protein [Patescibacteria group bacterium]